VNWKNKTTCLIGRFQPWHGGHQALFERAISKTGQVCIMVRDTEGTDSKNPFNFEFVKNKIDESLLPLYEGKYEVIFIPNITHLTYGRDVGYKIEQEVFDEAIHSISATKIRKEMGIE
jgi:nicotinamide mononucleotide adenylyltransferase